MGSASRHKNKTSKCANTSRSLEAYVMTAHHYHPVRKRAQINTSAPHGSTVAAKCYFLEVSYDPHQDCSCPRIHPSPLWPHGACLPPPALSP